MRQSNVFSEDEIEIMLTLFELARVNKPLTKEVTNLPGFNLLVQKVTAMRKRIEEKKAEGVRSKKHVR